MALTWGDAARMRLALQLFEHRGRRILTRNDRNLTAVVELFREDLLDMAPIWSDLGIIAAQVLDR